MREDNITVNALWIGKKLSATELLTIKSFLHHGHSFVLWAYDKIETSLPEGTILKDASTIIPHNKVFRYKFSNQFGHGKGSYAGFSDIFRYKLLYQNGGWWTDMDVTCLKPLDFTEDYVFRTHHSLPLVGNIMKCPKNSTLMKKCFDEASTQVDENNRDWHLPIQILVDNVTHFGLSNYIKDFSNADSWNIIRKLLRHKTGFDSRWHVIHWVNEEWRRNEIQKDCFLKSSLFYDLLEQYNIESHTAGFFKAIQITFRLSKIGFGIRMLKNRFTP